MKKIGIIVDNYKLNKFVSRFKSEGYSLEQTPMEKLSNLTTLTVNAPEGDIPKITRIIRELNFHFSSNKN